MRPPFIADERPGSNVHVQMLHKIIVVREGRTAQPGLPRRGRLQNAHTCNSFNETSAKTATSHQSDSSETHARVQFDTKTHTVTKANQWNETHDVRFKWLMGREGQAHARFQTHVRVKGYMPKVSQ